MTVYRQLKCQLFYFKGKLAQIRAKIEEQSGPMPNIIVAGNFNLPDVEWTSYTM